MPTFSGRSIMEYVKNGRIKLLNNSIDETNQFESKLPYEKQLQFGAGEKAVMTAYKYDNTEMDVCRVLDERDATNYAKRHGIKVASTVDLIKLLMDRGHITEQQYNQIITNIRS